VLLRQPVSLDRLREALRDFEIAGQQEPEGDNPPTTLVIPFRPEVEGHVLVTNSDEPWPDAMGDPSDEPDLFVAWSLGQFGPLAFPGCLERAVEQTWEWEEGRTEAPEHVAHVRILSSYVLVGDEDADNSEAPLVPDDYDPIAELDFLTKIVTRLLELPEAICYFNPGGELLRDAEGLREGLNFAWAHELPPLDMWTNIRLFRADEAWSLMDTIGNGQLDIPDLEALFQSEEYDPTDVHLFLRNASLFLLTAEEGVSEGDTADGPGDVAWQAFECDDGLSDPPRATIRWIPEDGSTPPVELLEAGREEDDDEGIGDI